jgi:hypothetical protein
VRPATRACLNTKKLASDLHRFINPFGVNLGMMNKISARRPALPPLADGQLWRMPEANLRVTTVGKRLVHYKLGKPNAIRMSNSINSIDVISKYLKAKKAVLV